MDNKIVLIGTVFQKDSAGIQRPVTTESAPIWCDEESVEQSEHTVARNEGYENEVKVSVWPFEYGGQKTAKYRGRTYIVYRNFLRLRDGRLELYLGQKAGAR